MNKKHVCPTCGSALQEAAYQGEVFYACRCGHGTTVKPQEIMKGVVSYIQHLGSKTVTQLLPKSRETLDD